MSLQTNPCIFSIAGSDPSGGAGIQADLKTIAALGGYGCCAVTALTVQNTRGVRSLNPTPPELLVAQCEAVLEDIPVDAVKIGMLPDIASVEAVAGILQKYRPEFVVWDPVMVATSGDALVTEDITEALMDALLPHVHMVTPNLNELAQLTHSTEAAAADEGQVEAQGHALIHRGARAVLAKGGHFKGQDAIDWLFIQGGFEQRFSAPRIDTENTHGSGCTLSSAIACLRPQCANLPEAVGRAKQYVQAAICAAAQHKIGKGNGPLAHFHAGAPRNPA